MGFGALDSANWMVATTLDITTENAALPLTLVTHQVDLAAMLNATRTDIINYTEFPSPEEVDALRERLKGSATSRPSRTSLPPHTASAKQPVITIHGNIHAGLHLYCLLALGEYPQPGVAASDLAGFIFEAVPIPQFHSPPDKWETASRLLSDNTPGAVIILSQGIEPPGMLIVGIALGTNVAWGYFGKPVLEITSESWQRWLRKRLGLPPEDNQDPTDQK